MPANTRLLPTVGYGRNEAPEILTFRSRSQKNKASLVVQKAKHVMATLIHGERARGRCSQIHLRKTIYRTMDSASSILFL